MLSGKSRWSEGMVCVKAAPPRKICVQRDSWTGVLAAVLDVPREQTALDLRYHV